MPRHHKQIIKNIANTNDMRHISTFTLNGKTNLHQISNPLFIVEASVDGIRIDKTLIDTGAEVSAISLSYFKKLPADIRKTIKFDNSVKVRTANKKQLMDVVGYVSLNIQIGSDPPRGNKCELLHVSFVVIKELSADCIIGQDILLKYFDSLDFNNRHLLYGSKLNAHYRIHLNSHIPHEDNASAEEEKLEDKTINMFTMTLSKSISVLPNCSTFANLAVINNKKELQRLSSEDTHLNTIYMRSLDVVKDQTNGAVTVADGVYDVSQIIDNKNALVQFNNTSPHSVRIRKGTVIGTLQLSSDENLQVQFITHKHENENRITNISSITVQDDVSQEPIDHYLPLQSESKNIDIIKTIQFNNVNINQEQLNILMETLKEFKDCFAEDPQNPSRTSHIEHEIHTGDHPPMRAQLKRFPPKEEEFIANKVAEMLKNGTVVRSRSAWASRPALALKANGELRFCINYIPLNRITSFDAYPIPIVDSLLDCLRHAMIFSGLDLASGYWQIRMKESDAEKTAFLTKQGLFHFKVMPFGLKTAPATFVRLMNDVFADILWKFVIIYFDDIVIFSKSFDEHIKHIRMVMKRLRQAGLQAKSTKSLFCVTQMSFCGYIVSAGGHIQTHPNKIKAINEMPRPNNIHELRAALGLCNYYRRFVRDYAAIAAPLYQLTAIKDSDGYWPWTDECETAFNTLKNKLITAPILNAPDWMQPFIIYTDASAYAMGAVLAQVIEKKESVIRYWSKTFTATQRKYSTTEREAMAIICAIREFNCYIGGRPFTVVTDHQPLIGLKNLKDPHGRIARWMLEFQGHTFDIIYRAGEKNHVDALSRIVPKSDVTANAQPTINMLSFNSMDTYMESPSINNTVVDDEDDDDDDDEHEYKDDESDTDFINVHDDENENDSSGDEALEQKYDNNNNNNNNIDDDSNVTESFDINQTVQLITPYPSTNNQKVYVIIGRSDPIHYQLKAIDDDALVITQPVTNLVHYLDPLTRMNDGAVDIDIVGNIATFNAAQRADEALSHIITYLTEHKLPDNIQSYYVTEIINTSKDCHINNNGTLVHVFQPTNGRTKLDVVEQVIIPKTMLPKLMAEFHDSPLAGHMGINKTYDKIRERYYWPHMLRDITNYIKSCDLCQRRKSPLKVRWPIRSILPTADEPQSKDTDESLVYTPFSEIVVDAMGPLPVTARRKKYIVVFVDRLTRWPEAFATTNIRSKTIALLIMNEIIPRYGAPRTLLSDQGSNFLSKICTKLYSLMRIKKLQTSAYFPQCNGLVERFNRTLGDMLAMYVKEQYNDWDLYIPWVLFAYRTAVNVSTLYTPFYLLHGYEATYPMDMELRLSKETFSTKEKFVEEILERVEIARRIAVKNLNVIDGKLIEKYKDLHELPEYKIGELILVYDPTTPPKTNSKLMRRWTGPYQILKRLSAVNYEVKAINPKSNRIKKIKKVHIYRIRPYIQANNMRDSNIPSTDSTVTDNTMTHDNSSNNTTDTNTNSDINQNNNHPT